MPRPEKEAVVEEVAEILNGESDELQAEAGGHPMAAGAFVHQDALDKFLEMSSMRFSEVVNR